MLDRVVLTSGTVRPEDVPDDLTNSYIRDAHLEGDWSKKILTDVSLYRCTVNIIFPPWPEGFYSRCHYEGGPKRPYEGSVIPPDVSSMQVDAIAEIIRQRAHLFKEANTIANWFTTGDYYIGSAEIIHEFKRLMGGRFEWGLETLFEGYPKPLLRYPRLLSNKPDRGEDATMTLGKSDVATFDELNYKGEPHDLYAMARYLEGYLPQYVNNEGALRIYLASAEPFRVFMAAGEPEGWRK